MANAQDSFNGMKASILRSTNPQLVSYAKLHEAANLQLDVKNVQKIIINENANIACLVYPIQAINFLHDFAPSFVLCFHYFVSLI